MEQDPRLQPIAAAIAAAVEDDGKNASSNTGARLAASSSTPSPSSQLVQQPHLPPHRGQEDSETPSSTVGSGKEAQHHQEQHHDTGADGDHNVNGADIKKSRACEACRALKVRCEPDPDEGPCKRCKKAGRNCVVTVPTRKRQKKTDSRVSELEKKIDALTASLQARAVGSAGHPITFPGGATTQQQAQPPSQQQRHASEASSGYGSTWGNGGATSWGGMEPSPMMQPAITSGQGQLPQEQGTPPAFQPPIVMAGQKRKAPDRAEPIADDRKSSTATPTGWSSSLSRPNEGDIVDRGLITMEDAASLFNKYKDHMVRHLPAVVFPPGMSVMDLRKSKPTLFLAIMAAATGENHTLQRILQRELMQIFAEKVFLTGEKNLELVQALHVAVIWYWPPEHFEELKFYQLVHIAAVMAIDIGLGKKIAAKRAPPPFRRNQPPDATTIECRRTWLTCFFLALNTSMSLRRPNLIRWTPFMAESMEILETSPEAAPTDKYFCHLVWTHRLAEEVGAQFSLDDTSSVVNISDARTQYALRALERDFDKYVASVPKNLMQPTLRLGFNVVNLYMHEMALHSDMAEQWRPPFNTEALKDSLVGSEPLSAAHINALSACLAAIDGIFDTFLSMDVLSIRCLPVFNFMRVAYGVVILIKMYFSASSPGSEMGKVINKDNMRVEYYLEALLDKFRATAADHKCRPAAKFLVVLAMLRSWFFKQGKSEGRDSALAGHSVTPDEGSVSNQMRNQTQRLQQQQQQQLEPHQLQQNANTPLQLLSEVATGRDSNKSRHAFSSLAGTNRQPPQPFFHDSVSTDTASGSTPSNHPSIAHMQGPSPTSASGSASGTTDLDSVIAPTFSSWMGTQAMPTDLDMTGMLNLDFEGLGFPAAESQDMYENSVRAFMSEPWFSSAIQGLPDPNVFPFQ